MNAISRHHHIALQPHLVAMDRALQRAVVNLALMVAGQSIAVLLQDEMLFARTAGVMDADRPTTAQRRRCATRHHRIGILSRIAENLVKRVGQHAFIACIHHVWHQRDAAGHLVRPAAGRRLDQDAGRAIVQAFLQFGAGDAHLCGIPADAQPCRPV